MPRIRRPVTLLCISAVVLAAVLAAGAAFEAVAIIEVVSLIAPAVVLPGLTCASECDRQPALAALVSSRHLPRAALAVPRQ